jgi:nucleotide-binding universal stress UspA family protein
MSEPSHAVQHALGRIVQPTDLSPGGESAFAHGLGLALAAKGHFYIVHADKPEALDEVDWSGFPGVRDTLTRWGLLEKGAPATAVADRLGLRVTKTDIAERDPVHAVLRFLEDHPCDLMVLATHAREGLPRWLQGSVAEPLAREARLPALFLAHGARGFVNEDTGARQLRSILVPVDHSPGAGPALELAFELARMLEASDTVFHLLHVGTEPLQLQFDPPDESRLRRLQKEGPVVQTIVDTAREVDADLIVMATRGREGFLDALRGSTTEQVLRQAGRAVLAVPSD